MSIDEHSFLYDPLYTMKTTLNGQLMLTMLCESLVANIPGLQMEPIVKQLGDYTILEFQAISSYEKRPAVYHKGYYCYPDNLIDKGTPLATLLNQDTTWKISKILRNSDDQVFSIGDNVNGKFSMNVNIGSFGKWSGGEVRAIGANHSCGIKISDLVHRDPDKKVVGHPLLTTDNVKKVVEPKEDKSLKMSDIEKILAKHYDKSDVKEVLETLAKG